MENPKAQAIARIKEANNVLVTVSTNPSVDQLAGAIGLTLLLNKLGKHATAVFSGSPPSTIEFLKPEDTLEKTTDSLRDFIIALDKSKADKLRYKVEDQHVKIFITPYRTSINQEDLEFSQGDFNVDVVVALGVHIQKDLDSAITAHGRILHDATVVAVNTGGSVELGNINWIDEKSSSLCEMLFTVGEALKSDVFDAQMSTAFLTGIVAETNRFSNQKTSSATMAVSAKLMAAGANQQLVATKLQVPETPKIENNSNTTVAQSKGKEAKSEESTGKSDGSLTIDHDNNIDLTSEDEEQGAPVSKINIDEQGSIHKVDDEASKKATPEEGSDAVQNSDNEEVPKTPKLVDKPPMLGGRLTANTEPEGLEASSDPLSQTSEEKGPLLDHNSPSVDNVLKSVSESDYGPKPPSVNETEEPKQGDENNKDKQTPTGAENLVDGSSTVDDSHKPLDNLRQAVDQASISGPDNSLPQPTFAVGSTPLDIDLGHGSRPLDQNNTESGAITHQSSGKYLDVSNLDTSTGLPTNLVPPDSGLPADNTTAGQGPMAPPPGPPPIMPQHMPTSGQQPLPNAENDNQEQQPLAPL